MVVVNNDDLASVVLFGYCLSQLEPFYNHANLFILLVDLKKRLQTHDVEE